MTTSIKETAQREAAKLFMPPWPAAPPTCAECVMWDRKRNAAVGPLRGTVVSDANVMIRRHAAQGHQ